MLLIRFYHCSISIYSFYRKWKKRWDISFVNYMRRGASLGVCGNQQSPLETTRLKNICLNDIQQMGNYNLHQFSHGAQCGYLGNYKSITQEESAHIHWITVIKMECSHREECLNSHSNEFENFFYNEIDREL